MTTSEELVIEYSKNIKTDIYASDVADELKLPYDLVCQILNQLVLKGLMSRLPIEWDS